MYKALLAAALLVALAPNPAKATLQIAATINGANFACVDNTACDTNAAVGTLSLGNLVIGGVQVNGSVQTSQGTPGNPSATNILNTSSLSVINPLGVTVTGIVTVSDTSFSVPINSISLSGSGTFQTAVGSQATLSWYADTANGQGADTAGDTPGTLLASTVKNVTLAADSISFNNTSPFNATSPYSMTENVAFSLIAGGQLINRGQTMLAQVVPSPEPASMALLGAGLLGLGMVSRKRGA